MESTLITLPNGMRLAVMERPGAAVDYFGVSVDAGSRDDPAHLPGLAHFVEHTIFKGTDRHRSSFIINRMESVGGELNAFTSKEETVIYSIAPTGHLPRSASLIAELVTRSTFPAEEIDREREVVLDEIASYLDSPPEAVVDDFEDLIFAGNALGHNILGKRLSVLAITPQDCMDWLKGMYAPERMVLFYSGPLKAAAVEREALRCFGAMHHTPAPLVRVTPPLLPAFSRSSSLCLHQAHTLLGVRMPGAVSPGRAPWVMLANILGGPGMNSLLNVELREKRGLVYNVDATTTLLSDCGLLQIYFGCDYADIGLCLKLIHRCVERVADGSYLTPTRMERARRQYLGQLTVALDNTEGRTLAMGRAVTLHGRIPSPERTRAMVQAVTAEQICAAARALLEAPPSRLTFS